MPERVKLFQVDAFTNHVFGGNPAAVCLLTHWLPSEVLQKIAAENFLPETAFFVPGKEGGHFDIKWFTPDIEMDLCGHATLAAAHVIFNHLNFSASTIFFNSNSGVLIVTRNGSLLTLDFPSRAPSRVDLPESIAQGFNVHPAEVWKARDYILVFEHAKIVKNMMPNRSVLDQINLDCGGIIITAKGSGVDFVSRFFTPQASIFEDPVTGSAHCSLIPLWADKIGKTKLVALQLSARQGKLFCEHRGERVLISGEAITYLEGHILI